MALQPSLSPLLIGNPAAPHTLEVYLDFVCPFSAKIFNNALDQLIKPAVTEPGGRYDIYGKVKVILRLHPQPWHGSSTFLHEAALAVLRVAPNAFWDYARVLFKHQEEFYDIPVSNLTPIQIRAKLVALGKEADLDDTQIAEVAELLKLKSTPNGGVAVTDDLKYNIKIGRHNSIHVSPTVLFDGLIAGDVSSSWGDNEWATFFKTRVAV